MREAIISDVHGNLEALEAVLKDIEKQNVDRIVCLGDTIGYGADPEKCIDLVMQHCTVVLDGNHERAVDDFLKGEETDFSLNTVARIAAVWTSKRLNGEHKGFLTREAHHQENGTAYVHGSPRDPVSEYLSRGDINDFLLKYDAIDVSGVNMLHSQKAERKLEDNFLLIDSVCFNGHNHIPGLLIRAKDPKRITGIQGANRMVMLNRPYIYVFPSELKDRTYEIRDDEQVIVNVGAVGQPRNCDWRASYFIYDGEKLICRRVEYDYAKAAKKILDAGLPEYLAERLLKGV